MKIFTVNLSVDQLNRMEPLLKIYNSRSEIVRTAVHYYLKQRHTEFNQYNELPPIPTEGLFIDQPYQNPELFVTVPGLTTFRIIKKELKA